MKTYKQNQLKLYKRQGKVFVEIDNALLRSMLSMRKNIVKELEINSDPIKTSVMLGQMQMIDLLSQSIENNQLKPLF